MAKLTTTDFTSITANETSTVTRLNNNFTRVENALENTLSLDGTAPNQMEADLDMNSNDVLNVGTLYANMIVAAVGESTTITSSNLQFASIAALRAYATTASVTNGSTCYVTSYYSNGNEGGGVFRYDSADTTSADDNGLVILDANNRRWKRVAPVFYSPMMFGAYGDGTTDDTTPVQAAFNAVAAGLGGCIVFTKPYKITNGITYTAMYPIALVSQSVNIGYIKYAKDSGTALSFDFTGSQFDNHVRIEGLGIYHAGTTSGGLAVDVDYDGEAGGNNPAPFTMRECAIDRFAGGAGSFANGIRLNNCPHALIERNYIRSGGGSLSSNKLGNGIEVVQWAQGTIIFGNRLFNWDRAMSISDERYVGDPAEYQAEGIVVADNRVINCDVGLYGSSTKTEVAWSIYNNVFNARQKGISIRNILGMEILGNKFQTNGGNSDVVNIELYRDAGNIATPASRAYEVIVANNRAFSGADLELTITGVSLATEAVVNYTTASSARTITAISSANPAVLTYSGSDEFAEGDELYISGITTGPTELNGLTIIAGTVDTGANTIVLTGIDGTAFSAAWSAGGTVGLFENTGTVANGDVLFIYEVNGTTQINNKPWIVSDLNTGAGTFKIKDYYTGAYVNSTAWTAYSNTGTAVRYQRFLEVKGGKDILVEGNMTSRKNIGVHLWPETKNVTIAKNNRFINNTNPRSTFNYINDSSYKNLIKLDVRDFNTPVTKTANFTVEDEERRIIVNQAGTTTVTLPTAADWEGETISITTIQAQAVNSASSNVVPRVGGSAGTAILAATDGAWADLVSDGTNWIIIRGS